MKRKVEKEHRRSIRLKDYDYANGGAYFVTIVTQAREGLFGEIINTEPRLNDAGRMIERWWFELNSKFRTVETDDFVIMPNHFHGVVIIADVGADLCVGPDSEGAGALRQGTPQTTRQDTPPAHQGTHIGVPLQGTHPLQPVSCAPLPTIVQCFKTMTTNEYLRRVKTSGWGAFQGKLWQRNYYEHVIRNEVSLNRIREYILNNPAQWASDPENPAATAAEDPDMWRLQERHEGQGDQPVAPTKTM